MTESSSLAASKNHNYKLLRCGCSSSSCLGFVAGAFCVLLLSACTSSVVTDVPLSFKINSPSCMSANPFFLSILFSLNKNFHNYQAIVHGANSKRKQKVASVVIIMQHAILKYFINNKLTGVRVVFLQRILFI